ncbi:peptidoglycan-binding protein [Methylocystis sp. H62]|uniref:peptidoglycan-binding domain-containing protein n=1 Tax=Methylocystis sp. H62 TaxID=2785789 RepID=UPI0018C2B66E|nr:peptidoglycan-binding domain-containing protein [Methylocystis sp. H62]MBG0794070.1 peptidoglycan-binding protein [Methylocystis sp. H62]
MLSASVGQDGSNLPDDVKAVQRLLGDLQIAAGTAPADVDGVVSADTVNAILDFQQQNPDLPADGTMDPEGSTFIRLDEVCADLYAAIAQEQGSPVLTEPTPLGAPDSLVSQLEDIRSDFSSISPNEPVGGADQFPTPIPSFNAQLGAVNAGGPLLGAVQVIPVVIIFLMILALLIIITSSPLWQRAAKQMVQGLKDRSRLLSQKIRDAVQDIIDTIEDLLGGTQCAELCADEINSLKDLQQQINDLLDSMPANDNDPDAIKQQQFQLARLYEQVLAAQQAVVDCLVRNGC